MEGLKDIVSRPSLNNLNVSNPALAHLRRALRNTLDGFGNGTLDKSDTLGILEMHALEYHRRVNEQNKPPELRNMAKEGCTNPHEVPGRYGHINSSSYDPDKEGEVLSSDPISDHTTEYRFSNGLILKLPREMEGPYGDKEVFCSGFRVPKWGELYAVPAADGPCWYYTVANDATVKPQPILGVVPEQGIEHGGYLHIRLKPYEVQSGVDRLQRAEALIRQLPTSHEGRNTWLMNFGAGGIEPDTVTEEPCDG